MKTDGKDLFVLSLVWIAVSLLWFFWVKSTVIGVIWLCLGIAELIIAIIKQRRKK